MSSPPEQVDIGKRPIDKGWAWMVVLGASVCLFFMVGGIRSLGILLVEFLLRYESSSAVASLMIGVLAASMSLVSPFVSLLGAKYGFRYVCIMGGISLAAAFMLTSFAPNIIYVIAIFGILSGVGYGCMFGPSLCVVGLYFKKRRSLANGLAVAGGSVGQLAIPILTRFIIDEYGFTGGLLIIGAFQLNVIPAAMLMRTVQFYMVKPKSKEYPSTDPPRFSISPVHNTKTNGVDRNNSLTGSVEDNNSNLQHITAKHIYKKMHEQRRDSFQESMVNGRPASLVEPRTPTVDEDKHPMLGHPKVDGVRERLMRSTTSLNSLRERVRRSVTDLRQTLDDKYVSTRSLDIVALEQDPPGFSRQGTSMVDEERGGGGICSCCCKSGAEKKEPQPKQQRQKLMDWSLLKNYLFIIFIVGNCLGNAGYINSCMYVPPHAVDIGISKTKAAFLLAIVGITDLCGRVFGGWFSDLGLVKRSNIMAVCMSLTGIITIICMFFPSYESMVVLSCTLGVIGGFFVSLIAVVLVDFLGLEMMAQAMGLSVMCQGLFNMPIPTILGLTRDRTGNYAVAHSICGAMMILSAICFALEPCARRLQEGPQGKTPTGDDKVEETQNEAHLCRSEKPGLDEEYSTDEHFQTTDKDFMQNPLKDAFIEWEQMDRESVI